MSRRTIGVALEIIGIIMILAGIIYEVVMRVSIGLILIPAGSLLAYIGVKIRSYGVSGKV